MKFQCPEKGGGGNHPVEPVLMKSRLRRKEHIHARTGAREEFPSMKLDSFRECEIAGEKEEGVGEGKSMAKVEIFGSARRWK